MEKEGSEWQIKTKDEKLSQISWDLDQGLNYKPPFFFSPQSTSAFVGIPVTKPLHNPSVTLSAAELLCTAPGSKFQPLILWSFSPIPQA